MFGWGREETYVARGGGTGAGPVLSSQLLGSEFGRQSQAAQQGHIIVWAWARDGDRVSAEKCG